MTAPLNNPRTPPYKLAGAVFLVFVAFSFVLSGLLFRGVFQDRVEMTMLAGRAGLSLDPGSKVTFNGVPIGRLLGDDVVTVDGVSKAKLTLSVDPKFLDVIPQNVTAQLLATTVFGNKYIALSPPPNPSAKHLTASDVIDASHTTVEFNTLFETVTALSEQVDPIKLNSTLSAAAQALDGLGDKFGQSLINGNTILDDLNPRMGQLARDARGLADLAQVYAEASPDLWAALENAVTTARTLNDQRGNLDQALMASVGFGNSGADIFERGGPYLVRGAQDLIPTSRLLDKYSPQLFCTIRNYHDVAPKLADAFGGNGFSVDTHTMLTGAGNPYVYPDNLPRVNARGGPEGRPGCWQPITRDLWPMPYLVMDTGASIAPYNHLGLGQPMFIEYVWGRQVGENTINP